MEKWDNLRGLWLLMEVMEETRVLPLLTYLKENPVVVREGKGSLEIF
jgi:hypothetical protein